MNLKFALLGMVGLALASCSSTDSDYENYQEAQRAQNQGGSPSGSDPYGNVPNPYGVPSNAPQPGGEVGQYQPDPATAPYQPLPGVPANAGAGGYTIPSTGGTAPPAAPARVQTHVVSHGDSLWGISRKYGASVESIRQANGIEGNLIRVGQTLQIPR